MALSFLDGSHAYFSLGVRLRSVVLKLTVEHDGKVEGSQRRLLLAVFCEQRTFLTCLTVSFHPPPSLGGIGSKNIKKNPARAQ